MTVSNKDIASLINNFLNSSLKNDSIPEDNRESIEFAIESINDAFQIDETYKSTVFGGKSLPALLDQALVSASAPSSSASTPEKPINKEKSDSVPVHIDEVDEKVKENAEALKLQGNKAMAQKDFDTAIAKYTEAIKLVPTNAVFYSNRAAAYSSQRKHELALQDAIKATEVQPTYAKAWSRMGLAKYAMGDAKGALKAYEQGLKVEGEKPTEAMKKGYETAKKRVAEQLSDALGSESNVESTPSTTRGPASSGSDSSASTGAGAGGMPDLSSLLGGLGGAGAGGLGGLLNNPQVMQAAQQMMQNPDAMREMMSSLGGLGGGAGGAGGAPDFSAMMNNPAIQNMARNFMGGNNGAGAGSGSGSGSQ
ncbi:unnamed protein product [Ambrosiozyma monospora]|uniref:Unnamed protein product n=1 Tax=Ambrosiozyma monospora TaxID=43982 RepID=A0A9W6YZ14_AMBMO|nr:unnamed protein product [Ambrosiozyma monospora]